MEIPCKDCLVLPMCRAKTRCTSTPISYLSKKCYRLKQFCYNLYEMGIYPFPDELKKIIYKGHPELEELY